MSWAKFERVSAVIGGKGGDIKIEPSDKVNSLVVFVGDHMIAVNADDLLEAAAAMAAANGMYVRLTVRPELGEAS